MLVRFQISVSNKNTLTAGHNIAEKFHNQIDQVHLTSKKRKPSVKFYNSVMRLLP